MSRLPRINPEDLRDHADEARVDRIWARVQRDLPGGSRGAVAARSTAPSRRVGRFVLLAACLGGVFAAGLLVGAEQLTLSTTEDPEVAAVDAPLSDVFAAGTRQRTFALPGGGRLVLQPESLVEVVEVRDGSVRLHLLRGRAAVDASTANLSFAVVAGEALALAPAGSVVSLSRLDKDVDVAVEQGSVEVLSPAGRRVVGRGQTSRVPIVAAVSSTEEAGPAHVVANQPPHRASDDEKERASSKDPAASEPAEPVAATTPAQDAAPSWLALYEKDKLDEASRVLEERGGISAAITSAQSARELMALWELAGAKRPDLAIAALKRVADEFPSDPNGAVAAKTLGDTYQRMGQVELAAKYRAQAMQSARLSETLLCRQLSDTPRDSAESRHKAKSLALDYLQRFPDGTCREDAKFAVEAAAEDGDVRPNDDAKDDEKASGSDKGSDKASDSSPAKDQKSPSAPRSGTGDEK